MDISYYKQYEPIFGSWKIVSEIGRGSYGTVFEIERNENYGNVDYVEKSALKVISIPPSENQVDAVLDDGMDYKSASTYFSSYVEELVKEFAIMSKLKGESNIVSYEDHDVKMHKNGIGRDILIRMELLTPLPKYVKQHGMTKNDVIDLGISICNALELCREKDIIHRDIKPGNIFVSSNGKYKLGDFGIARVVDKSTGHLSKKGTYTYMAPEVYKEQPYGPSVDIYSLGIVLYRYLNNNREPFIPTVKTFADEENARIRRMSGEPLPPPENADSKLAAVILKACAYDPAERYSSPGEMRTALQALYGTRDEYVLSFDPEAEVLAAGAQAGGLKRKTGNAQKHSAPQSSEAETVRDTVLLGGAAAAAAAAPRKARRDPPAHTKPPASADMAASGVSMTETPLQMDEPQHVKNGKKQRKKKAQKAAAATAATAAVAGGTIRPDEPQSGNGAGKPDNVNPGVDKTQAHIRTDPPRRWLYIVLALLAAAIIGGFIWGKLNYVDIPYVTDLSEVSGAGWSDWVDTLPEDLSHRKYDIRKAYLYRSQTLETIKSKDDTALLGWECVGTEESWSDWSDWSEWSTEKPSESEDPNVKREIDHKTQYSSRTVIPGEVTREWSGWIDGVKEKSSTVQTQTLYEYYYFQCPVCGAHLSGSMQCQSCHQGFASQSDLHNDIWLTEARSPGQSYQSPSWGLLYKGTQKPNRPQYRYLVEKQGEPTYSNWSGYSDNEIAQTDGVQVERREVYCYRESYFGVVYCYERWSDWSDWTLTEITESDTVRVDSGLYYCYKQK